MIKRQPDARSFRLCGVPRKNRITMVYCAQSYFALQETVFTTQSRDLKIEILPLHQSFPSNAQMINSKKIKVRLFTLLLLSIAIKSP